jgi:hypothetical protein
MKLNFILNIKTLNPLIRWITAHAVIQGWNTYHFVLNASVPNEWYVKNSNCYYKCFVLFFSFQVCTSDDHGSVYFVFDDNSGFRIPERIRPRIDTFPVKGHFLSMQLPSPASLGILKPKPVFRFRFRMNLDSVFLRPLPWFWKPLSFWSEMFSLWKSYYNCYYNCSYSCYKIVYSTGRVESHGFFNETDPCPFIW